LLNSAARRRKPREPQARSFEQKRGTQTKGESVTVAQRIMREKGGGGKRKVIGAPPRSWEAAEGTPLLSVRELNSRPLTTGKGKKTDLLGVALVEEMPEKDCRPESLIVPAARNRRKKEKRGRGHRCVRERKNAVRGRASKRDRVPYARLRFATDRRKEGRRYRSLWFHNE